MMALLIRGTNVRQRYLINRSGQNPSNVQLVTSTVQLLLVVVVVALLVLSQSSTIVSADQQQQKQQHLQLEEASCSANGIDESHDCAASSSSSASVHPNPSSKVPETCGLVMAQSSIPGAGWGVFSLVERDAGSSLLEGGEVVLHITDPNPQTASGMKRLVWDYAWNGQEMGGQYEGQRVLSISATGVLANGHLSMFNIKQKNPKMDGAGVARADSPGAGSFTHYHGLEWFVRKDLHSGDEIFLDYGNDWFRERGYGSTPALRKRSIPWLRENGYCLDNLMPGNSTIPHAGRGAFASRDMVQGSILAPIPVLPVARSSLVFLKQRQSGEIDTSQQLVLNYCFGHNDSSILLFPYAPRAYLVNHSLRKANAAVQWSAASSQLSLGLSPTELLESKSQLLLELVATRPISKGEEIMVDYGEAWEEAWLNHIISWSSKNRASSKSDDGDAYEYVSASSLNQRQAELRTDKEQRGANSYPNNIFTSCYYDYNNAMVPTQSSDAGRGNQVRWDSSSSSSNTFESRHLRPCIVMDRLQSATPGTDENLYTVLLMNRPGLRQHQRIPKHKSPFIVTHVPRRAIQFSDKMYTTDQHLNDAFRHEIGLPDAPYPAIWKDLEPH